MNEENTVTVKVRLDITEAEAAIAGLVDKLSRLIEILKEANSLKNELASEEIKVSLDVEV